MDSWSDISNANCRLKANLECLNSKQTPIPTTQIKPKRHKRRRKRNPCIIFSWPPFSISLYVKCQQQKNSLKNSLGKKETFQKLPFFLQKKNLLGPLLVMENLLPQFLWRKYSCFIRQDTEKQSAIPIILLNKMTQNLMQTIISFIWIFFFLPMSIIIHNSNPK